VRLGFHVYFRFARKCADGTTVLSTDKITPFEGYDGVFDDAQTNVERIERLFEEHRLEAESLLKHVLYGKMS
jgi:hypothetical protein